MRSGRQGEHLLRRDRQHSARDTGEAAARHPGARVHAARRNGDDQGRRPHHRGDQLRPAGDGERGALPRGPLLPPPCDQHLSAAAPRAEGRHSDAGAALPRQVQPREQQVRPGADRGGGRSAGRLRLARQRARTRKRDRAGGGAHVGPAHRSGSDPRTRAVRSRFPHPAVRRPARGDLVQGRDHQRGEAADRGDARSGRRGPETRRRAPAHQADDAERDDQAVRDRAAAEEERGQRAH